MAISIKSQEEIEIMRIGGRILAEVLIEIEKRALPGVSTLELDQFAEKFIRERGGIPGFKGYQGFPGTLCTTVDHEIVHGIPRADKILKEGDLFTVDCGVIYKGLYTDAARSFGIGNISKEKQRLISTAKITLENAINIIEPGIHLGEISIAIQETIENAGYKVIHDLTGHGIGKHLHEEPIVLNYFTKPGPVLQEGMTLAIEPIFAVSTSQMRTLRDNWTIVTADNSLSIQQENTILITKNGPEILTTT